MAFQNIFDFFCYWDLFVALGVGNNWIVRRGGLRSLPTNPNAQVLVLRYFR